MLSKFDRHSDRSIATVLLTLIFLLIASASSAEAGGISGAYVGHNPNTAFLMTLVESSNGQISGHYEQVFVQPSGQVNESNDSVSGVIDRPNIVLTLKPAELLSDRIELSGTIKGGLLHLSGGGGGVSIVLNLTQSDEQTFRNQAAALIRQGNAIIKKHAQTEADSRQALIDSENLKRLTQFDDEVQHFTKASSDVLPKFQFGIAKYKDITAQMQAALEREQSIYGDGQASVERGQISVNIDQIAIQTTQIHIQLEQFRRQLADRANLISDGLIKSEKLCQEFRARKFAPHDHVSWSEECQYIAIQSTQFQPLPQMISDAFSRLNAVWTEETAAQKLIIDAAQRAN